MMNRVLRYISAAFLPEHCPYCGKVVKAGAPACPDCEKDFPETSLLCYAKGGYPCASAFIYDGIFAEAVKHFKFHHRTDYSEKLAEQIAKAVAERFSDIDFNFITCVPMHKKQQNLRGYNQSQLLAEKLSKAITIPYLDLLVKHKENEPQHSLSGLEKRDNVKGVYKAVNTDKIKGNNILVIDDILTTGYTLGECCKTLTKAKAKIICCATLCAKITK